ncbi:unnamed protein product [Orchesella dallaii]|uniref:Phospholipid/glycerol acyltransferase domain-containing protein n=1 Tax=Orchesella dallaii TaxID=48710 RepID=A0ABP1PWX1_9HEXA
MNLKLVKGIAFVLLWYTCIIWAVFFIYCPLIFLLFVNRRWYRKCTDIILSCWELYPASLLEILMGCRVCISGDDINPEDGAILIMNHRNRLDWFFLWAALLHASKPPAHRCKFVLKSDVRIIPGIGWGLQMAGYLFIHRNWEKDRILLKRSLDYFKAIKTKYQILIFPEGTNISENTKAKSHSFADKNGLQRYEHVLHPRTTGFTFLAEYMKSNSQLDAVYDITVGYPKTLPSSETDLLLGNIPEEVHFHIKRFPAKELPSEEAPIKKWCEERWEAKEDALTKFYKPQTDRKFSQDYKCDRPWNAMYFALVAWTVFTMYTIYLTFTSSIALYWILFSTASFIIVSYFSIGIQQFEIDLYNKFDKEDEITQNMNTSIPATNGRNKKAN